MATEIIQLFTSNVLSPRHDHSFNASSHNQSESLDYPEFCRVPCFHICPTLPEQITEKQKMEKWSEPHTYACTLNLQIAKGQWNGEKVQNIHLCSVKKCESSRCLESDDCEKASMESSIGVAVMATRCGATTTALTKMTCSAKGNSVMISHFIIRFIVVWPFASVSLRFARTQSLQFISSAKTLRFCSCRIHFVTL